ncbi:hypothetical protein [Marinobacter zhanjiangensis]|uniref:Uncharacterized protein n=1 Tax=Marinobacter zhanjiangensis TaxID=578215 RepID=A0ABQ3B699_9GAMM|nr:hypothetical protein [Marinobacter zhanjiangensis]GGY81503.1 hypothetical protein GCM10007071_31160 [Marinobacter zhanjiangensis]
MGTMEPNFLALVFVVCSVLVLGALYLPIWAILHQYLTPRLDGQLFRRPFFQSSELHNYQTFPLSLLRSLNYILLVGWPSIAKRRRFRGFTGKLAVSRWAVVLCRIQILLALVALVLAVAFFGWGGFMAVFVL